MRSSELRAKLSAKSLKKVKTVNPVLKNILVAFINMCGRLLFMFKRKTLPCNVKKILFVSLYFNGDVLFHSAVFEFIRQIYPHAELQIWIKSRTEEVIKGYTYFTKVHVFDDIRTRRYNEEVRFDLSSKWKFFKTLRKEKFDLAFDLTGLFWTAVALFFAAPKYSSGFNFQGFGFIYNFEIDAIYNGHLIDKHINIIAKNPEFMKLITGFLESGRNPIYHIKPDSKKTVDDIIKDSSVLSGNKKVIVLHTTAGWDAKKWDLENFVQLIDLLGENYACLIIGGREDIENGRIIQSRVDSSVLDLTGKLSFDQSAEILRRADIFIGSDSGPLYLAEAVGAKTLSLFGPTNPLFSAPRGKKHSYIYKELFCSASKDEQNCKLLAGLNCRTHDCMKLIAPSEVYEYILRNV